MSTTRAAPGWRQSTCSPWGTATSSSSASNRPPRAPTPTSGASWDAGSPAIAPLSANAGVELPDSHVVVGPASIDGGAACLTRAWEDGLRPTAVLAMSDVMAIGAIGAAVRLGLDVPADLSVVGFDDIELASHVQPPLTTVHQPVRRKGEEACRLLLAAIERRDGGATRSTASSRPGSSSGARAARRRRRVGRRARAAD